MGKFSLYNYAQLSDANKVVFNRALARGLSSMLDEMKCDEELNSPLMKEFIATSGHCSNSTSVVNDLYSKVSSGIQVGCGNQNLFLGILSEYTAAWEITNR